MKKTVAFLSVPIIIFLAACLTSGNETCLTKEKEQAAYTKTTISRSSSGMEETAIDPGFDLSVEFQETIKNIDLTGNGDLSDSATVTGYISADSANSYAQVEIFLYNEKSLLLIFPGNFSFARLSAGDLLENGRNQLVVDLNYFGSNYGASDIHIIAIEFQSAKADMGYKNGGYCARECFFLNSSVYEYLLQKENAVSIPEEYKEVTFSLQPFSVVEGYAYDIKELEKDGLVLLLSYNRVPYYAVLYYRNSKWHIFHIYDQEGKEADDMLNAILHHPPGDSLPPIIKPSG